MKGKLCKAAVILMTLAWMGLIFCFSAQNGAQSGGLSAIIAEPVTEFLISVREETTAAEKAALYLQVDGGIRKAAHFLVYMVLGACLTVLLKHFGVMQWLPPWIIGVLYAISDEWHQSFSPQRSSEATDVLIDAAGVLCGILLIRWIGKIRRKNHAENC